jgi:hypothetical protein
VPQIIVEQAGESVIGAGGKISIHDGSSISTRQIPRGTVMEALPASP